MKNQGGDAILVSPCVPTCHRNSGTGLGYSVGPWSRARPERTHLRKSNGKKRSGDAILVSPCVLACDRSGSVDVLPFRSTAADLNASGELLVVRESRGPGSGLGTGRGLGEAACAKVFCIHILKLEYYRLRLRWRVRPDGDPLAHNKYGNVMVLGPGCECSAQ